MCRDGTHHAPCTHPWRKRENVIHIAPLAHIVTLPSGPSTQLDPKNERALVAVGHLEASLEVRLRARAISSGELPVISTSSTYTSTSTQ
ncbi:hypothetical protein Pcac1_g14694 [Phytophthora cactorum]|nr:hypothetical protein Pcac1_g14694 [Phytophthora cactorum]